MASINIETVKSVYLYNIYRARHSFEIITLRQLLEQRKIWIKLKLHVLKGCEIDETLLDGKFNFLNKSMFFIAKFQYTYLYYMHNHHDYYNQALINNGSLRETIIILLMLRIAIK